MFTYFYSDFYCKNTVPAAVKHRFSVLEGVAVLEVWVFLHFYSFSNRIQEWQTLLVASLPTSGDVSYSIFVMQRGAEESV